MFVSLPGYSTSKRLAPRRRPASQKQLRADIVRVDVLAGQRACDLAFFHDIATLGDRQDGVEILLDEDNRGPQLAPERLQRITNVLHDRRLDTFGRLVE